MKLNLKTIGYLVAFVIGGAIFQISCSSDSATEAIPTLTAQKVVYMKINNATEKSLWTCDADGTNDVQVPITLPAGFSLNNPGGGGTGTHASFSSDSVRIRFIALYNADHSSHLYSCNMDGSDLIHLGSWTGELVYLN